MRDPKYRYSILAIIILGVIAYLPPVLMIQHFFSDSYCYLTLAKGIRTLSYSLEFHRNLKYLPFYPITIFLVNSLSLGLFGYVSSAKLVSMCSLIACSCLVFDFCFYETRSYRLPLLAGILSVLSPIFIGMSGNPLTEPLFCFLCFATFVFLLRKKDYVAWIFAGLAIMTRYEGVFLLPALVIAQWKSPRQSVGAYCIRLIVGFLILLIICAPWAYFILSHLGEFFAYSYFQDLTARNHTGLYFLSDSLLSLSPLIALLGLIGIYFYPRGLRPGVILYIIGYSLIHIYWAWRALRFTLPLAPLFTVGTISFAQFLTFKLRNLETQKLRNRSLMISAIVSVLIIPVMLFDVYVYFSLGKFNKDLRIDAIKKILEYDARAVVLTNIEPRLCGWYGLLNTITWHGFGEKEPYQYIAQKYIENQARYLIWSRTDDYPFPFFKELVQKGFVSKQVHLQEQTYTLTFYSIYFLENGNIVIFSLDLKPRG